MANREAHQYSAGTSSGAARSCGTASPQDIDARTVRRCPAFIETLHDLVHREERIEQIAVPLDALLRDDGGVLRNDEPTFLQQTNMLGNGIAREVELLCDDRFTRE